jgi:hypothetical protein
MREMMEASPSKDLDAATTRGKNIRDSVRSEGLGEGGRVELEFALRDPKL